MELWNICSFHRKFLTRNVLHKVGVLIWAFCYLVDSCVGYNLDLETVTVHRGESRSKFGYSVALHQDQGAKWYGLMFFYNINQLLLYKIQP